MAKLTREEVIARVKAGKSLLGEDLSELNLRWAYLCKANLSGANLKKANLIEADLSKADLNRTNLNKADLSGANLKKSNLSESNLDSANLESADLSGADLTGANIYNIATADWKIDGVKCEYVYNCRNFKNEEVREKTRRDFAPGEFEKIYKSFPKLELIFKEGFSNLDHRVLLAIIDHSNDELPNANLKVRKLENVGDTTIVTLITETKEDTEKIADILLEQYAKFEAELTTIRGLLTHPNPSSPLPLPPEFIQLKGIAVQLLNKLDKFKPPHEVIVNNQSRPFIVKLKEFGKGIGEGIASHTIFKALEELFKHFIGIG